jgi:hypothetical protein
LRQTKRATSQIVALFLRPAVGKGKKIAIFAIQFVLEVLT